MRVRTLVPAALLACAAALSAPATHAEFINGERLMQACTARDVARHADCEGYAAGVLDRSMLTQNGEVLRSCIKGVNLPEIRDTIARFGRDHAEAVRGPGPALVIDAVRAKYRCGGAK